MSLDQGQSVRSGVEIPAECVALRSAYEVSGLTGAQLAKSAGVSTSSIQVALNGFRYRAGQRVVASPPDERLVKLAAVLGVLPDRLRELGRGRAAQLLERGMAAGSLTTVLEEDEDARDLVSGRAVLAQQVLSAFSDQELEHELERRRGALNVSAS